MLLFYRFLSKIYLLKSLKKKGEKMKIGIDKIGFAMPKYFLNIEDLAVSRNENPIKFTKGLLQKEMSVSTINEDIISLGASAAY